LPEGRSLTSFNPGYRVCDQEFQIQLMVGIAILSILQMPSGPFLSGTVALNGGKKCGIFSSFDRWFI